MKTIMWISVKLHKAKLISDQIQKIDGVRASGIIGRLPLLYAVTDTSDSEKIASEINAIPGVVTIRSYTAEVNEEP